MLLDLLNVFVSHDVFVWERFTKDRVTDNGYFWWMLTRRRLQRIKSDGKSGRWSKFCSHGQIPQLARFTRTMEETSVRKGGEPKSWTGFHSDDKCLILIRIVLSLSFSQGKIMSKPLIWHFCFKWQIKALRCVCLFLPGPCMRRTLVMIQRGFGAERGCHSSMSLPRLFFLLSGRAGFTLSTRITCHGAWKTPLVTHRFTRHAGHPVRTVQADCVVRTEQKQDRQGKEKGESRCQRGKRCFNIWQCHFWERKEVRERERWGEKGVWGSKKA